MSDDRKRPREQADLAGGTALVTGAGGFVGSHIASELLPETNVRAVDDFSTGSIERVPDGVDLYRGDVRDSDVLDPAIAGVDVVFHQAGLSSVPESLADPMESHERNATGTLAVLEAARRHDTRVVVASSAAVYGQPSELPVTEDHPKAPTSPYGVDKLAADRYASVYADRYGLPTVTLRYFNVYGPGQSGPSAGVVSAFRDRAVAGRPLVVHGDGRQTRDFVHVADVVDANLLAAGTDATGQAFNVGTGTGTQIAHLAAIVRSSIDVPVPVEHTESRDGDIEESRADLTRARQTLGYEPQVSLTEGVRALVEGRPVHEDAPSADHP